MTRNEAKEQSLKKMICKQSQVPFLRLIDKIYDDFDSRKCTNCKHCDQVKEGLIHCSYFEQFMPIEIGKCDIWKKDEK